MDQLVKCSLCKQIRTQVQIPSTHMKAKHNGMHLSLGQRQKDLRGSLAIHANQKW